MFVRRSKIALAATALLTFTFSQGCGDGKPSVDTSKTEATVSGVVKVRGKPADGGTIIFNASNSERIVAAKFAPIGKDGAYTITTYTGGNQVSFDGDVASKNQGVGLLKEFVDVKAGTNQADFDLMGEGGGKKLPYDYTQKPAMKGRGK
jgi:hypothetical protein